MTVTIWIQTGVNKDREGFVQLMLDEKVITQMTPANARDLARNLQEGAEGAETDAFMVRFCTNTLGMDVNQAGNVLIALRRFRESRGKQGLKSDPAEFVITPEHEDPRRYRALIHKVEMPEDPGTIARVTFARCRHVEMLHPREISEVGTRAYAVCPRCLVECEAEKMPKPGEAQ